MELAPVSVKIKLYVRIRAALVAQALVAAKV